MFYVSYENWIIVVEIMHGCRQTYYTTLYTDTLFLEHEHNRYDESAQVLFDSISRPSYCPDLGILRESVGEDTACGSGSNNYLLKHFRASKFSV